MPTAKEKIFGVPRGVDPLSIALADATGGVYKLQPGQTNVIVTIPATGRLTVMLPPACESQGEIYCVYARARAANYSDGDVLVVDAGDAKIDNVPSDTMTAAADCVIVQNVNGLAWLALLDVTT